VDADFAGCEPSALLNDPGPSGRIGASGGNEVMSNLICGRTLDLDLLHPTDGVGGLYTDCRRVVEPQEPIHVHVRVRQSSDSYGDIQPTGRTTDHEKLPVGTILDCYV
jgi:hypothetical protein